MSRPSLGNKLIEESIKTWIIENYTFALIENKGTEGGYVVKVFPHDDDYEAFWLDRFETESGAAWSILNFLDEQLEK